MDVWMYVCMYATALDVVTRPRFLSDNMSSKSARVKANELRYEQKLAKEV